jgi:hypothetical protein
MSNWPARNLPEINIGGTMFYMDTRMEEFRDVDDFMNRIPFMKLPCTRKGFMLDFDKETKNIFRGSLDERDSRSDVVKVRLPPISQMDPVGWKCMIDPECPAWGSIAGAIRQNRISHIEDLLHGYKSLMPKHKFNHFNGMRP